MLSQNPAQKHGIEAKRGRKRTSSSLPVHRALRGFRTIRLPRAECNARAANPRITSCYYYIRRSANVQWYSRQRPPDPSESRLLALLNTSHTYIPAGRSTTAKGTRRNRRSCQSELKATQPLLSPGVALTAQCASECNLRWFEMPTLRRT